MLKVHRKFHMADKESCNLKKQLDYVLHHSAFYRKKFSEYSPHETIIDRFFELPYTIKEEILNDQYETPVLGSNLCTEYKYVKRIQATSGKTRKPFYIPLTDNDIKNTVTAGVRCFKAAGLTSDDRVVHCLNYCLWMGGYTDHQCLENVGATVIPFGVGNTELLIKTILELQPTVIHCTPSYLSKIEFVAKEKFKLEPRELKLKKGLFGGESFFQDFEVRKTLEEKWGFTAMNANYGISELLSIFGAECKFRNGLHFMGQDIIFVELINPEKESLLEIEKGAIGEFVITNLAKEAYPLIRYRTHDIIEIIEVSQCDCGRSSFRFKVLGRSDDMVVIKGINVFPERIKSSLGKYLGLLSGEFRLILKGSSPYKEAFLLIEKGNTGNCSYDELSDMITEDLRTNIGISFKISIVEYGAIERTEGKTNSIIRE